MSQTKKRGLCSDISMLKEPPLYQERIVQLNIFDTIYLYYCLFICFIVLISNRVFLAFNKFDSLKDYLLKNIRFPVIETKKAEIKRIFYLIFFVFIIYFLFLSVLPGNERMFVCAAGDDNACTLQQGDTNVGTCTAYGACGGAGWNIGGSGDSTGNPSGGATLCCGDDANENVTAEAGDANAPSVFNNGVNACCNIGTDCNYDGTCYATTSVTGTIPNRAYCNAGTWNGGDTGSTQCDAIVGSGYWQLGGETAALACCGDDNSEYRITESSSTDAPLGYNDAITACCDTSTDCNYNYVCTATGSASSPAVPSKAYCSSGVWYGGDYSSAACTAVAGAGAWDIGGETAATECCTDDNGAYINTRLADEGVMDSYADNSSDDACCLAATDCVHASTCYDDQDITKDADGNGDTDYCESGTWKDCLDNTGCPSGKVCSQVYYDCVSPDGYIYINNLGVTGIDHTNQEFTSSRSVALLLGFSENATACRYTNHPNSTSIPYENYTGWTAWEPCISSRFWVLSNGTGLKYVFYHINFSDVRVENYFNDSISYNFTGSGLDTTQPGKAIVYHDNYTNDANNAIIRWYNATDRESNIFELPLRYQVKLFNSSGYIFGDIITTGNEYNFSFSSRPHGTSLYANVTVINSANMKSNSTSGPLVIDLVQPNINSNGSVYNISKLNYQRITLAGSWFYANKALLSWNASDATSGISEYSYILTQDNTKRPDNIGESTDTSKIYNNLKSGRYFFFVKAKDKAGNWGGHKSVNFSVDNTAPSRPEVLTETPVTGGVRFTWSESSDSESGILLYRINLTTSLGTFVKSFNQTDISNRSHTFSLLTSGDFNATVGAMNGAGIWMWSNGESSEVDITEPEIYLSQNVPVASNYPIIMAWTNEPAACIYNGTEFKYTNTTYHESKLAYRNDGYYSYLITCTDNYGNFANAILNLSIDGTLTANLIEADSEMSAYEKLISTFQVSFKDTAPLITGWNQEIEFNLDGEPYPFDIFDNGNGYYNISFVAPKAGSYVLQVGTGYDTIELNLTSKELGLVARYQDSYITSQPDNEKHITSFILDRTIGLANDDDETDIRNYQTSVGIINLSSDAKSNIFIINTKKGSLIQDRDSRLDKAKFITLINPSFGYPINEDYLLAYTLKYDEFMLSSNYNSLKQGTHKIRISMTDSDTILIRSGSGETQSILTG